MKFAIQKFQKRFFMHLASGQESVVYVNAFLNPKDFHDIFKAEYDERQEYNFEQPMNITVEDITTGRPISTGAKVIYKIKCKPKISVWEGEVEFENGKIRFL